MGGKAPRIARHLQGEDTASSFCMIDPSFFEEPAFQRLSCAARLYYVTVAAHATTTEQRTTCFAVATEYNGLGLLDRVYSDEELRERCYGCKKPFVAARWFVAPDQQMRKYGFSQQYGSKLRAELVEHRFIRVIAGGKGSNCGWHRNATLFAFSSAWRRDYAQPQL